MFQGKFELLWVPPAGEVLVGIVNFRDEVLVATDKKLYRVVGDDVFPVAMEPADAKED